MRSAIVGGPREVLAASGRPRPALLLTTVALSFLVGCSSRHADLADLRGVPGATATYPGAVVYLSGQQDGHNQVDGAVPATITVEGCTSDPEDALEAYFERLLTSNGWARSTGQQPPTGAFTRTISWDRGRAHFDLNLDSQVRADTLAVKAGKPGGCVTGYETLAQLN